MDKQDYQNPNIILQKGMDENKIMKLPMPEKYNDWLISSFYKVNLKFLYHKLITKTNPEL